MAINVNPVQLGGLVALAGRSAPDLQLKPWAVDQTQGLLGMAELQQRQKLEEQKMIEAMLREQYQQENLNAREQYSQEQQNYRNAQTVGATLRGQDVTAQTAAERLAQERQFKQADLSLDAEKFDFDKAWKMVGIDQKEREMHEKNLMNEFTKQIKLRDDEREASSRIYGGFLTNPTTEQQTAAIQELYAQGIIGKQEALEMVKLDPKQFGQIANIRSGIGAKIKIAQAGGIKLGVDENGNIKAAATSTEQSNIQKDLRREQLQQANLNRLEASVGNAMQDPLTADIFTTKGDAKEWLANKEQRLSGIPVIGALVTGANKVITGGSKEDRNKMVQVYDGAKTQVNQLFNAYRQSITGAAAAVQELDRLQQAYLNGEMSMGQYVARMKAVREQGMQELQINQGIASGGFNLGQPQGNVMSPAQIDYEAMAKEAIANGADPQAVMARLQQLQSGN